MTTINSPLFCLTGDTDWTSDFALRDFLDTVTGLGVRPTIFATHRSPVLDEMDAKGLAEIGIHPNFLPGSTHGDTQAAVIDHLCRLFPRARAWRAHWFFDHTTISRDLFARGLQYDSNLCLHLQPHLQPLLHQSGLVRYPVFWEDDVHWSLGGTWDVEAYLERFLTPGLKVLSVHPFFFAANVPDAEFYRRVKPHVGTVDGSTIGELRHEGRGVRTFVTELVERLRARGERFYTLAELHAMLAGADGTAAGRETPHTDEEHRRYWAMSEPERQAFVKRDFDHRNPKDPYATSRDVNARELEIESIARQLTTPGRLLDLGCGNGYTLISLARSLDGWDLCGVDFSEPLVAGAIEMREEQRAHLRSLPEFVCDDAITYVAASLPETYDYVLTERFLQNLPSPEAQRRMLAGIHRILRPGGRLLLCEGSDDGFEALNDLRAALGLARIPSTSRDNVSAIRFRDGELEAYAQELGFRLHAKLGYSLFFAITRVLHPLLVAPQTPRFDARINDLAREIQRHAPMLPGYGSNVLWVWGKDRG